MSWIEECFYPAHTGQDHSGCAASYFSSTKLRPLTQLTSQRHTPVVWVKDFPGEQSKVGNWKGAAFKHQRRKYELLTKLRLPKNHSGPSHSPHQPWKTLNFGKRKQKWQDGGKRQGGGTEQRRDTYSHLYFPSLSYHRQVCIGRKALSPFLSLSWTHVKAFPVRSVRWPNSIMGDWLSPQVGPIFSHIVLLTLAPGSPSISSFH